MAERPVRALRIQGPLGKQARSVSPLLHGTSESVRKSWKKRRSTTYPLRNCLGCGQMFNPKAGIGKYCSTKCRNHSKFLRRKDSYQAENRKLWLRARQAWGRVGIQPYYSQMIARSEEYIAEQLPKYGFRNVHLMRVYYTRFPFDIIAEKDGEKCAIDVTFALRRDFSKRRLAILPILGITKFFVVHLKPDFSFYIIKEIPAGQHSSKFLKTVAEMK